MTTVARMPDSVRQAALTLHGLSAPDREWILGALSEGQRSMLVPLLGELETLGIPRELGSVRSCEPGHGAHAPDPKPLDRLDEPGLKLLLQVLEREPLSLTMRLLAMREWPWRSRLNAMWRHDPIVLPREPAPDAPCLRAALVDALAQELAAVRIAPGAPASPWQRWGRRMFAWGGAR